MLRPKPGSLPAQSPSNFLAARLHFAPAVLPCAKRFEKLVYTARSENVTAKYVAGRKLF